MRGVYTAAAKLTSLTAAKTLLYLTAPANKIVRILSIDVTGVGSNVTLQNLEFSLDRISTLGTPSATSNTPVPEEAGDQAAGSTVKVNVTASEPTYASTPVDQRGGPNIGPAYQFSPLPEERPVVGGGASVGLRVLTSTFASQDLVVQVKFQEEG